MSRPCAPTRSWAARPAKHTSAGSIDPCQNIPLYRNSVSAYVSAIPIRRKGRSYVVSNRGSGSGGRRRRRAREVGAGRDQPREVLTFVRTSGAGAYGQIAWSWLSLLQSSLAEVRRAQPGKARRQFARTREAKGKVGSRESAPYAVKPPRREGRTFSGFTCHPLCIACAFSSHDGQAGASRRPAFPAPFRFQGVKKTAKLGRKRREEEKACLRVTTSDIVGWAKRKRAHASRAAR
jgi:hypothetical protein